MNLSDFKVKIDEWINELYFEEKSKNTLSQYKRAVMKFVNWYPYEEDRLIDKQLIMDYKQYLQTLTKSPNSMNIWIVALNKYLKWLGLSSFTVKKYRIQSQSSNENSLSLVDYKRLLRMAKRLGQEQLYMIMRVLAMTGCRIGELEYFTVENIELTPRKNIIVQKKDKIRRLIIRQDLSRELKKYCKDHEIKRGYIFLSPILPNKMINQSSIWKQMKKLAGKARVNKSVVHAHSFRHLFATVFLDVYPDNILDLADLLGHNDLKTTRIYTKTSGEQQRKKMEKMHF